MTTRKPVSTKRKAARATKAADVLRKVALSAFVASTFTAYALHERQSTPDSNLLTLPDGSPVMAAAQAPTPLPEWIDLTTLAHSQYKDGAYTGTRVDSYYGSVQVQAVIQFGSITDVQFLVYPEERRTSRLINTQAVPWLQSEAIRIQSANVNIISGATLTSEGFITSLRSALDQAMV